MKKIIFTLLLLLLSPFSLLAQKFTWTDTAAIILDILEDTLEDTEIGMETLGGGEADVYAVEDEYAIEYIAIFNRATFINSLTNTELKKIRDGITEILINEILYNYGEATLNAIMNSIAANNGEIRLIYAYEGGRTSLFKEITITSNDMKRIYKNMGNK